ncbi:MAG: hypothetical protein QM664_14100 [Flavihumibacter sp.]
MHTEVLAGELAEWDRVVARLNRICSEAAVKKIGVLVDAEKPGYRILLMH